jgi:hypothetical protein
MDLAQLLRSLSPPGGSQRLIVTYFLKVLRDQFIRREVASNDLRNYGDSAPIRIRPLRPQLFSRGVLQDRNHSFDDFVQACIRRECNRLLRILFPHAIRLFRASTDLIYASFVLDIP